MAHILLIDDMASVRRTLSAVLKLAGHTVTQATDGREGLEVALAEKFDLVITDIMIPGVDGTEVIMTLNRQPGHPPIIAISGGGNQVPSEVALHLVKQAADASLAKPFESNELLTTIDRLLQRKAA